VPRTVTRNLGCNLREMSDRDGVPWIEAALPPALERDEVHVWYAGLDHDSPAADCLSRDERERAGRFIFEKDRRRFTAARAMLRTILGKYLRVAPAELDFRYGALGKPFLADDVEVQFNVSHSEGVGIIGIARGRQIGVDLERIRGTAFDWREMARYFPPAEQNAIEGMPADERRDGFFRQWVRKEAYLKARGEGLFPGISQPMDEAHWPISNLTLQPEFAAAVCVEGTGVRLRQFSLG
jgi:4'-phosphopantetheinyl transferase